MSTSDDQEKVDKVNVKRTRSEVPTEERALVVDSAIATGKPNIPRRRAYAGDQTSSKLTYLKKYVPDGYIGRGINPLLVEDRLSRGWEFASDEQGERIHVTANQGKSADAHNFIFMIKRQEFVDEDNADRAAQYESKLQSKGAFTDPLANMKDVSAGYSATKPK